MSDGSSAASVYVLAASLDSRNKLLGHSLEGMTATAKPGTDLRDPNRFADFFITASAQPKATTLRFIVRDSANARMGATDLKVSGH